MKKGFQQWCEKHDGVIASIYWRQKYNSMETKYEVLKETTKDELFNKIIDKCGEPLEVMRLRKENSRIRNLLTVLREERQNDSQTIKKLKGILKEHNIPYN